MDHIGDLLNTTKSTVEKIITNTETKKIINIALTDALEIEKLEYKIRKNNFEKYKKNVLSPAIKIVQDYETGGIKRNAKGNRTKTTDEEHGRKERYLEAKKILEKEGIDAFDKNWRAKLTEPKKPKFNIDDLNILLSKIETHNLSDGWHEIVEGKIAMCYFNAGHVLGSSSPLFRITDHK